LPSLVKGQEIVMTQPLVSDVQVQALLARRGLSCVVLEDDSDLPLHRLVSTARTRPSVKPPPIADESRRLSNSPVG
jgi:hypothetical protein